MRVSLLVPSSPRPTAAPLGGLFAYPGRALPSPLLVVWMLDPIRKYGDTCKRVAYRYFLFKSADGGEKLYWKEQRGTYLVTFETPVMSFYIIIKNKICLRCARGKKQLPKCHDNTN